MLCSLFLPVTRRLFCLGLAWSICFGCMTAIARADEPDRVTLRFRFGMKDQQPTDWSGELTPGSGRVESIRGWRWAQGDSSDGNTWSVKTRRRHPQGAADRRRIAAGLKMPMTDNGLLVTLTGCNETDELRFDSQPTQASFRLNQLSFGKKLTRAEGNLVIERVPTIQRLAATHADEDYPASATGSDGTVYVVYLAFTRGRDFQGRRERVATKESGPVTNLGTPVRTIEQPGDLAYLAQPAGGE